MRAHGRAECPRRNHRNTTRRPYCSRRSRGTADWCSCIPGQEAHELTIVKDEFGRVNGIVIDPVTNFRLGGADPRENSYALGW